MCTLKSQTVGIRSTGELLHPAQYPFTYFTSSSSGSYLHLASSSYLWLRSVPPSEISILQYIGSRHGIVDAGITAFDGEQLAGCYFAYDQSTMAKVALFPCRRKVHASYLRSVFHDDVKIELIRRRPVVSGCPQIWQLPISFCVDTNSGNPHGKTTGKGACHLDKAICGNLFQRSGRSNHVSVIGLGEDSAGLGHSHYICDRRAKSTISLVARRWSILFQSMTYEWLPVSTQSHELLQDYTECLPCPGHDTEAEVQVIEANDEKVRI